MGLLARVVGQGRQNRAATGAAFLLVFLAGARGLHAQYPVNRQVNTGLQQSGQMLDANPSLGGGRYNVARPVSPLVGGNAFANGIVGRGMSLRSVSPIRDPSVFMAPLGSSALSAFRQDSVSVADTANPLGSGAFIQPYYDPATSTVSPGFLQGLSGFGGSRTQVPRAPELNVPLRLDPQRGLYAKPVVPGPVVEPPAATTSSLFGPQAIPSHLALPWAANEELTERRNPPRMPLNRDQEAQGPQDTRLDQRLPSGSEALVTPLDRVLREETLTPRLRTTEPGAQSPFWRTLARETAAPPSLAVPGVGKTAGEAGLKPAAPRIVDTSVLPGYEVFTDMRLALALSRDPGAAWFEEMRTVARARPELNRTTPEQANLDREQFLQRMLNTPLETLTGGGSSALNDQMLKAESLMDIGHYYEAADRYDAAHGLDPTNPLPLVGKGHALLAAGEYRSAALALTQGLEHFPEVARFSFDLTKLMGGGESIDIRRADLMKRLQQRASPELLFLLGYIEYHTGDRARGLADLEKAARIDRLGSVISRYPAMLRGQGVLPPPKVSDEPSRPPDIPLPTRDNILPQPPETLVVPPLPEPPPSSTP